MSDLTTSLQIPLIIHYETDTIATPPSILFVGQTAYSATVKPGAILEEASSTSLINGQLYVPPVKYHQTLLNRFVSRTSITSTGTMSQSVS